MSNMARPTSEDEDFGKDHGLIHEAVVTGRKVGAGHGFWSRLAHNEDLFRQMVTLVNCNGYQPTISQKRAREIMGCNMFGVEEAIAHYGVNPSRQQLAALAEVPFTEEVLEAHKATHILVAVFPMSILDIRGKVSGQNLFYEQDWYNKQSFAKEKGEVEWRIIRKTLVENSASKNWNEQQALLSDKEETLQARVMIYTIIGHHLATGERLLESIYVRCSDLVSDGYRVGIGDFDRNGLHIGINWGDSRVDGLGLASSLKFQN